MRFLLGSILGIAVIGGGLLFGEPPVPNSRPPDPDYWLPAHWSRLGLSDEQKQQTKGIVKDYQKKIIAVQDQIARLQAQVRQLQKQKGEELEDNVLTDPQRTRLKELQAAFQEAQKKRNPRVLPPLNKPPKVDK